MQEAAFNNPNSWWWIKADGCDVALNPLKGCGLVMLT